MKYVLLLSVVCFLGCGGSTENTLVPNDLTPEQVQTEIDANKAIETPPATGAGV